ncbi:hypothetical protein KPL70_003339 [Citrus sinensis]|nr:hypothetical protein KPL70_003339 [Citrus sinensis]
MAHPKVDLEKFTGKNDFNMWKVKMEALLITQGLGDALEPVTKKEGMEASSSLTPQQVSNIDKMARSTIILSFGDSVIREVAKEKTVADLWAKLETIYMTKSLANRLHIKKMMFTLKMAEGSSLDDHIDEFNKVCDTLETIDESLSYESKALLLVSSLPQSYSNFVDALMYGRQTLSLDEVKVALNTRGLQEKSVSIESGVGLTVKGKFEKNKNTAKNQKQSKPKTKPKDLKYFHCHKEGHFKKDCRDLKNKNKERVGNAATAEEEEDGYESADVCVAIENIQKGKWILDSGCTFHMSPYKGYFSDYQDLDGGRVMMGNNSVCKVIGIGVSNTIESIAVDKTTLWHLRLGHMSIKGLKELSKQGVLGSDTIEELVFCEECILDLWGPAQIPSLGGNRYFMTMIDDYSRRVWVYVLKSKDQSQLPKGLWAETLLTACYLVNLSPSAGIDFKTPLEKWYGKPSNYADLKAFGCDAYAHIKQGKLSPRALRGKFIGYPDGVKGYKLWCTDLSPPRCIISRDVIFNEETVLRKKPQNNDAEPQDEILESIQFEVEHPNKKSSQEAADSDGDEDDNSGHTEAQPQQHTPTQLRDYHLAKDREMRQIRPPQRYGYADLIAYALAASHEIDEDEPTSYKEAIKSSYKSEWQRAMEDEIDSLYKNNTWELVKKPEKRRIVGHVSIRVLLALTAVYDMELDQLDVKTAFLHGRLQEEILMTQLEGFVSSEYPDHVCLLKKSLYGLKQSPRQWYLRFDEFMISHGFMRCNFDCCVYYKQIDSDHHIYLLLYVDDMLIACKVREEIEALKHMLNSEFDMKDLGHAKKILGMEITRDRRKGTMFLSQKKYLEKVLNTFGMSNCKPVITPLASHFKLSNQQCPKSSEERQEMSKVPYANAVGCMMHAMVLTRPDISHALSLISRYMASPGKEHWKAAKWVLRYLNGTLEFGLLYGKNRETNEAGLWGYVDSDYAGDLDRRRSQTGYMFMLNGCLISWKASLQHVVALSTTEAEYTAASEVVKEALWLKGLISELGIPQKIVDIHCDSSSAIYLSRNPAHHEKTKHIDIKLHFIKNVISKGVINMFVTCMDLRRKTDRDELFQGGDL